MELKYYSFEELKNEIKKLSWASKGQDYYFFFDEENIDNEDGVNEFYIVHKTKWHLDFCVSDRYIGHLFNFDSYLEISRSKFMDGTEGNQKSEDEIRQDMTAMGFTELVDFDETPLSAEAFAKLPSKESMPKECE